MKNGISALQNAEEEITFDGINKIFCFRWLLVIQISHSVLILLDSFLVFISLFTQRVKMDRLTLCPLLFGCKRRVLYSQLRELPLCQTFRISEGKKEEKEGIALPFCTITVHQNHYYDSIQRIGDFNSKDTFTLRFGC